MSRPGGFPLETMWRAVLRDLNLHPADVLRRAELPEDLLNREGVVLSTAEYFRFWESVEALTGDPLFPLRLSEIVGAEAFLPPLFAGMCSPNLRIAAQRISRYKKLCAPMRLLVDEDEEALTLQFVWLDAAVVPPTSLTVTELVFFTQLTRISTREHIIPQRLVLPRLPEHADAYTAFFGVELERGETLAIAFRAADATRPFLTANEFIWETFEPGLRRRLAELEASATTAQRVRSVLLEALPGGQSAVDHVARKLAMSKRTLQRRLRGEGTSFQNILNETREELARHYLANTTLSCAEISFLLGFEDPNSFFRAFHAWTGDTPERVRQTMMH